MIEDMAIYFGSIVMVFAFVAFTGHIYGADEHEYIIYPVPNLTRADVRALNDKFMGLAVDISRVYASRPDPREPPSFWLAILSDEACTELNKDTLVLPEPSFHHVSLNFDR